MAIRAQSSVSSAQNEIDPSLTSNGGGYLEGPYGDLYATIGEPFAADSISTGIIDNGSTWTGFWQIIPVQGQSSVREEFAAGSAAVTGITRIYPSPFFGELSIDLTMARPGEVSLAVHDLLGRNLGILLQGRREAGTIHMAWRPEGIPAGSYLLRLVVDGKEQGVELVRYYR